MKHTPSERPKDGVSKGGLSWRMGEVKMQKKKINKQLPMLVWTSRFNWWTAEFLRSVALRRKFEDIWRKYSGRNINFTKQMGQGRWPRRPSEASAVVQVRGLESWAGCALATQSHNTWWGTLATVAERWEGCQVWSPGGGAEMSWLSLNVGSRLAVEEKWGQYFLCSQKRWHAVRYSFKHVFRSPHYKK